MARIFSPLFRSRPQQGAAGKTRPRRRPPWRPSVEALEARTVPGFLAPLNYDVGAKPQAVADFNADGNPDLAVANLSTGTVSVLLGTGDGSFQPARSFAASQGISSVAVGDFDGDGNPDLATANFFNNSVSVLAGTGDGSFQPARSFVAGFECMSVAVGDFNGDGRSDLAVANADSNTVTVLLASGDGSFPRPPNLPAGTNLRSVAVGDFNGDGNLDLAVANRGTGPVYSDSTVSVLLGNGDGSFRAGVHYAAGSNPYSMPVLLGDFDGDGVLDLAVSGRGGVRVLRGTGDGTFQVPTTSYVAGSDPGPAAVGDFDGDGLPDLAVLDVGSPSNNWGVFLLLNDGVWPAAPAVRASDDGHAGSRTSWPRPTHGGPEVFPRGVHVPGPGRGPDTAPGTFTGLTPGTGAVGATWFAQPLTGSPAPFTAGGRALPPAPARDAGPPGPPAASAPAGTDSPPAPARAASRARAAGGARWLLDQPLADAEGGGPWDRAAGTGM